MSRAPLLELYLEIGSIAQVFGIGEGSPGSTKKKEKKKLSFDCFRLALISTKDLLDILHT